MGGRYVARLAEDCVDLWEWFALDGDRRLVTGVLLATGFLLVGPVGTVMTPPDAVADPRTTAALVSALLSGMFFLFSIVVSVNSLFVSQQQNPLSQQLDRIQNVIDFRRQLEGVVDVDHVPARPEPLLQVLSGNILERAQFLQNELLTADFELREDLDAYITSLAQETGEMNQALSEAETTFEVLRATTDYNHDHQINDLRELQAEYGDSLDERANERMDEMSRLLQYYGAAREYFKTLYTRREFANLSRDLVLTSVPAVMLVASFLHFLEALPDSLLLVAAAEAVAFAPFLLVASYALRVAVVSKRTQAAGQLIVGGRVGDVEDISREK